MLWFYPSFTDAPKSRVNTDVEHLHVKENTPPKQEVSRLCDPLDGPLSPVTCRSH